MGPEDIREPDAGERRGIEARAAREAGDVRIAYALWAVLGMFGAHNFYIRRLPWALFELIVGVMFARTAGYLIEAMQGGPTAMAPGRGPLAAIVFLAWFAALFADLAVIPRQIRRRREMLTARYMEEARMGGT